MSVVMIVGKESELQKTTAEVIKSSGIASRVLLLQSGKLAFEYLKSAFKGKPEHPHPVLLLLDMQIEDMSGIEFLMNYSNFPMYKREETVVYIHTASRAAYIRSLPKVYECVKGIITSPLTPDGLREIIPHKQQKHTWLSWLKGFQLSRLKSS